MSLRALAVVLLLGLPAVAAAQEPPAAPGQPGWSPAGNNCFVWNRAPTIGETAIWTGACVKQRANGKGTLTWQTGDAVQRYDGTMVDGHLEGQGAYQLTPTMRYEGAFKADDFEGKGVMVEGGDRYEGLWRAGKRNGRGVLTTPGGNRYEGDFKDDAITGQGVLTLRDGRKFEGQLYDGKPHGQGKLTEPSGTYAGFWMNGCFNDGTRRASFGVDPAGCP